MESQSSVSHDYHMTHLYDFTSHHTLPLWPASWTSGRLTLWSDGLLPPITFVGFLCPGVCVQGCVVIVCGCVCGGECVCVHGYVCTCAYVYVCVHVCRGQGCMCVWGGREVRREICTRCDNVVTLQGHCYLPNTQRNKARWLPSVSLMLPDVIRPPRLFHSILAYWKKVMKASETMFLLNIKQLIWRAILFKANHPSCILGPSRSRRCALPVTMVTVQLLSTQGSNWMANEIHLVMACL